MSESADVIVIGLGAMGAATLYQLARRGVRAIGIDRFAPPHDRGSSHGETRLTRQAIGEGEAYVPLALRSHAIWRELEEATGSTLLLECGYLAIDDTAGRAPMHGKPRFVERTAEMAHRFGIAHERLSPDEAMKRFPQFRLTGSEDVYFEPGGGLVYAERCIAAQLEQARQSGARLFLDEPVTAIVQEKTGVRIDTATRTLTGGQVVIAAGGWTPGLVGAPLAGLAILRQTLHWFDPIDAACFSADRFPTFTWAHGMTAEDCFYGFPIPPGSLTGVKLATEQFSHASATPEAIDRHVSHAEDMAMHDRHVAGRLVGLGALPSQNKACFYVNAPDGDFVVDRMEDNPLITIVSACSGHGFKHSAGLGDHLAGLLLGDAPPITDFAIGRSALRPRQAELDVAS